MISRQLAIATVVLLLLAIGMSAYLWQLRRRESQLPAHTQTVEPITPPSSGPVETVTAWVAHDDSGTLRAQSLSIPLAENRQQRAGELLRALLKVYAASNSPHRLPPGADIHSVYLINANAFVIDVNSAFADGQISGIMAEELIVASMVQTLATNIPGFTRVQILVDGKARETFAGHVDLSQPYQVSDISQLAQELAQ
jgi:spore germination protein GerM